MIYRKIELRTASWQVQQSVNGTKIF